MGGPLLAIAAAAGAAFGCGFPKVQLAAEADDADRQDEAAAVNEPANVGDGSAAGSNPLEAAAAGGPDTFVDTPVDASVVDSGNGAREHDGGTGMAGDVNVGDATNTDSVSSAPGNDAAGGDAANDDAALDAATAIADAGECGDAAFAAPEPIVGLGLTGSLWGPALSADGQTLYLSAVVNSQEHVYVATRPDRGVTFSAASAVVQVNSTSEEGTPFPSWDGLALYFFSTRPGGLGDRDVWLATRPTAQSDFQPPVPLVAVNSAVLDHAPSLSPDGLTLYISSRRAGGVGGIDVYVATRALAGEAFSAPVLVGGDAVNSPADDEGAAITPDGLTIYFGSNRGGSFDIWTATRSDVGKPFQGAVRHETASAVGINQNPFLTADGQELFFSSNRDGTQRLWRSARKCQ